MYTYTFPKLDGGYRVNIIERCKNELNINPVSIYDTTSDIIITTNIVFEIELTEQQLNDLTSLMNSSPQFPPEDQNATVFYVKDLNETFEEFQQLSGVSLKLYYSETITGSGKIDRLELHANRVLTEQEKNNVKTTYANYIVERL